MFAYTKILTTAPSQRKENRPALKHSCSGPRRLCTQKKPGRQAFACQPGVRRSGNTVSAAYYFPDEAVAAWIAFGMLR